MAEPQAPQALTLYDAQTGAPVQVNAADVGAVVRSGRAGFAPGQDVPVLAPDGRVQVLKAEDAVGYFNSAAGLAGGAATTQQLRTQQNQDQYGGLGGTLAAGAAGVARGATVGLSDALLTGTGLVAPSTLEGLQDAHGIVSTVGEGLGIAAPALVSGGESLLARGALGAEGTLARTGARGLLGAAEVASAPARAVSTLGSLAERGVGAIAGEGLLGRTLGASAGAAVEGSLYGVGQAVSDASIRNEPLTAEKLVAAAGHGALLGGATGGALSVGGSLLRGATTKLGEGGAALLRRLDGQEARLASDLAGHAPQTEGAVAALAGRYEREFALKSTGANQPMLQKLNEMGQDIEQRVIRMVSDGELGAAAGREGKLLDPAQKQAAAAKIREMRGQEVGKMVDDLTASGVKADIPEWVSAQRQRVIDQMVGTVNPDIRSAASKIEDWLAGIEKKVDGSPRELWKAKKELGNEINWKGRDLDRYTELKKDLYFSLDREIQRLGTESAEKMGPDFAARWAHANSEYRAADWLSKAADKGLARETSNRAFGLSEQTASIAGAVLGGGGLTSLVTAPALAYASHVAKKYGADIGLQIARAARQGELVRTVEGHVDQILGGKVAALVGAGKAAAKALPGVAPLALTVENASRREPPVKAYEARSKAVTDYLASAPARREAATAGLAGTGGVQQQVQQVVQRGAEFLASKMPPAPPSPPGVPPHLLRPQRVSPDEAAKWLRYERAVNNPLGVLDDARRGLLTTEAVEAMKAVYPTLYGALQQRVWAGLTERRKPLSWGEKLRLGTLLDLPTDPALQPQAIAAFQAAQSASPAGGGAPGGKPAKGPRVAAAKPLKLGSLSTKTDQIGAR